MITLQELICNYFLTHYPIDYSNFDKLIGFMIKFDMISNRMEMRKKNVHFEKKSIFIAKPLSSILSPLL